jgi:iron complex outermembrane recepter protein
MQSHRGISTTVALILTTAAYGQEAANQTRFQSEDVVVTGTRVRDRVRLDTLSPVDVLTSESLGEQSTNELAEALSTLAPSINFPRPAVTDGTDHVRPATLRGLAPDQTLVLVNSKRRHQTALVNVNSSVGRGSSAVDLNALPLAAIERVEVLRDGASAQYGSDAIAGVLNIKLRQAREGGGLNLTYGQYETEVPALGITYDKSDGKTSTLSGWQGFPLGADGFLTVSGEYRDRNPTSRGTLDPRLAVPAINSRYGDPQTEDATLYLNAGFPVGDTWSAYGWAGYQMRQGAATATPRIANNANNDPFTYPNGFLPEINTDVDDIATGFGFRGPLGGWETDLSLVYGLNSIDYSVENSLNGPLVDADPNTPTQTAFDSGGIEYDQLTFSYGMVRGFDFGLAAPANFAVGLEARRETYTINPGEPNSFGPAPSVQGQSAGAQGFPGFSPSDAAETSDADRIAVGLYADLETQITEKLLTSVAVRAEDYDDFGSNVSGKLAARFDFVESFALRGAVSTGFRAPALQQQFFSSTATNFQNALAVQNRTLPVGSNNPATQALLQQLGATPLDAEESVNYSVGAVFRAGAFEATLDAYQIDIDDRIVLTENISLTPTTGARFFTNGVDTKTEGVDLVLRYAMVYGSLGRLGFTLSGNVNDTEIERVPPPGPNGVTLFDVANTIILSDATPENKVSFVVDWSRPYTFGRASVLLKATQFGDITDPGTNAQGTLQVEVPGRTLVDVELRAGIGRSFSMAIGADNVFDQYPDPIPSAPLGMNPGVQNTNGLLGFSRFSPYGFNGRLVYGRFGWTF